MISVYFFAGLKEAAGQEKWEIDREEISIGELRREAAAAFPEAAEVIGRSMMAVNEEFASDSELVTSSDNAAFLPPVSGG
ncbi:MoaD/ThiS family protein [Alkalicoccus chagannorensis]